MRECPACRTVNEASNESCDRCGYQFASDPRANPDPSDGVLAKRRNGIVKGVIGVSLLAAASLAAVIIYSRPDTPRPSPYPTAPIERVKESIQGDENPVVRDELRKHLRENFGMPGYTTSWYPYIKSVWVEGDTAVAGTYALPGSREARSICVALSGFVYASDQAYGLRKVEVRGNEDAVIFRRDNVTDSCR